MNPATFDRVRSLFLEASSMAPAQRPAFLDKECGGDTRMQHLIAEMLTEDTQDPTSPMIRPDLEALWEEIQNDPEGASALLPDQVGRYRIIRKVGEGGMGTVLEARQDQPSRVVALKLLRSPLLNRHSIRRFLREIELLGKLKHPGIAQVYDAGTAEIFGSTQPYLVMEFVRGTALTDYARRRRLTIRQRVELIARLCLAVDYAHRQGVIHRDLKPDNILVDESGDDGQPKILDFGVARALDPNVQVSTCGTLAGQLIGTLRYMSPEQAGGDNPAIDARTDVYALGILLFELLSGGSPYDIDNCSIPEALRIVQDIEPRRLGALEPECRGDLEIIAAKALHKDRQQRYASAAALGDDLRRYLDHEPIRARPTSLAYRVNKFTARHRGLVAGVVLAFTTLCGGATVSFVQWMSARAALSESEAVSNFLAGILASATPDAHGEGLLARDLLDQAAESLAGQFDDRPVVHAKLLDTIGEAYRVLGEYDLAAPFLQQALSIRRRTLGPGHEATATSLQHCARIAGLHGDHTTAESLVTRALEIQNDILGAKHPSTIESTLLLGHVLNSQGRYDEALELLTLLHRSFDHAVAPANEQAIHIALSLAGLLQAMERFEQAEALCVSLLEQAAALRVGQEISVRKTLAIIHSCTGRLEEAAAGFEHVGRLLAEHYTADTHEYLKVRTEYAVLLCKMDREREGCDILAHVRERSQEVLGELHPHTLWTTWVLIEKLVLIDEHERALPVVEHAVRVTQRQAPGFLHTLVVVHSRLGNDAEAARVRAESVGLPVQGSHAWQRPFLDVGTD